MRLTLPILLLVLALALPAYATDTALIDRDGVTTSLVLTPANIGAATAAQGATVDKVAGAVYLLADYANLQAAVDAAYAAGGGTVLNAKGATVNIATTFRPKTNVMVDLNGGTLKWTGGASGVMVENDATTYGAKLTGLFNGKIDAGSNTAYVFKFHSLRSSYYGDLTLISANTNLEFMHLYADAQADDPQDGVRNTYGNTFGPFRTDAGIGGVPVVGKVLTLEGFNDSGNWRGVTMNTFKGPWHIFTNGTGIDFKQYCDSNVFEGMYQITLTNQTTPGTCVVFNNSATPSSAIDVWGEHFDHLSCETWYPALAGQKAVVINHAGGITIDYLGNDRVAQGTWPVGMVTDNYSQGHKITYVEGAPTYLVKEYIKGDFTIKGTGNGLIFPDGSKQTTAPNDTAYDATTWNGDTNAPTKNAVRDKIESILATAGTGNVTGPVSSTDNALAQFSGTTGSTIKDGPTLVTTIGTPGADTKVPTEKAVRDALSTVSPGQSVGTTDSPTFRGTTLNGADWVAGTGTVSTASTSTLTANTAGSFSVLKAGASIKLSSGTVLDVLSITDTSNVLTTSNPGAVSALTWSYRNPTAIIAGNSVDFGYLRNTGVGIKGDGGSIPAIYDVHNWGSNARFRGSRANGTPSSPTAVTTNDVIMAFTGQGWVGTTNGVWSNAGAIQLKAGEPWTNTATGSFWSFITLANGATTASEKLRLYGDGGLQLGGTYGTSPGTGKFSATEVVATKLSGITDTGTVANLHAANSDALNGHADTYFAKADGATHAQSTSTTLDLDANDGFQISAASGTVTLTTSHLANGKYFDIEITSTSSALTLNTPLFTGATFPNGNNSPTVSAGKSSHYVCKGTGSSTAKCYILAESK